MLNRLIMIILILAVYGCGGGGNDSGSNTNASIVGAWSFIYPSSGCEESYTFNSNGTWSESALDEIQTGSYTFDESVNLGERHALSIVVLSDNGLSDCEGKDIDATGVTCTLYAAFKNNNSAMEWYQTLTRGSPVIILTKK